MCDEKPAKLNELSTSELLYLRYIEIRSDMIDAINAHKHAPTKHTLWNISIELNKYKSICDFFTEKPLRFIRQEWLKEFMILSTISESICEQYEQLVDETVET